jgi:hypothetical protein
MFYVSAFPVTFGRSGWHRSAKGLEVSEGSRCFEAVHGRLVVSVADSGTHDDATRARCTAKLPPSCESLAIEVHGIGSPRWLTSATSRI